MSLPRYEEVVSDHDARPTTADQEGLLPNEDGRRSGDDSSDELHLQLDELDYLEPHGVDQGTRLSKSLQNFGRSLSAIHLPPRLQQWMPSWTGLRDRLPALQSSRGIMLIRCFALLFVLLLAYLLFLSDLFHTGHRRMGSRWFDPEMLRTWLRDGVVEDNLHDHVRYLASFDHVAGTAGAQTQALYVQNIFQTSLHDVRQERFDVYMNFPQADPRARQVAIIEPENRRWEAALGETPARLDQLQSAPFFTHAGSGTAEGALIHVTDEFGPEVKGSIVLIKQGNIASQIQEAQTAGAVGCIIFSDAEMMPSADAVKRGSGALRSTVLGDPLSPGYPSLPDETNRDERTKSAALSSIPAIPLAWSDAKVLVDAASKRVQVRLKNEQDEIERQPIYNILGRIEGTEQPDKAVVVGNHRDALCFGATNPGSGTAVLLELVRLFGELVRLGWKPLRTLIFASW